MEARVKFLLIAESIIIIGTLIKVLIRRILLGWGPAIISSLIFPFGVGTAIVLVIFFIWNLIGKLIDKLKLLLNPVGAATGAAKSVAGKVGGLF